MRLSTLFFAVLLTGCPKEADTPPPTPSSSPSHATPNPTTDIPADSDLKVRQVVAMCTAGWTEGATGALKASFSKIGGLQIGGDGTIAKQGELRKNFKYDKDQGNSIFDSFVACVEWFHTDPCTNSMKRLCAEEPDSTKCYELMLSQHPTCGYDSTREKSYLASACFKTREGCMMSISKTLPNHSCLQVATDPERSFYEVRDHSYEWLRTDSADEPRSHRTKEDCAKVVDEGYFCQQLGVEMYCFAAAPDPITTSGG